MAGIPRISCLPQGFSTSLLKSRRIISIPCNSQLIVQKLRSSVSPSPCLFSRGVKTSSVDWKPIRQKKADASGPGIGGKVFLGLLMLMPIVSFGLGTWQIQRLKWKNSLITQSQNRLSLPPLPLPPRLNPDVIHEFDFRRVLATGTFRHDQEMFVGPRIRDGVDGYFLITPLERPNGSTLLVNRGWIPKTLRDPATRPMSIETDQVTIECLLRNVPPRGTFNVDGKPEQGLYHFLDIDQMSQRTNSQPILLEAVLDFNVKGEDLSIEQMAKHGVPIGSNGKVEFRNSHFQYVLTWYGVSLFTTIMLFTLLRNGRSIKSPLTAKMAHAKKFQ